MAPKNLPPAAKQAKIVEYFRESMGVYTLKELEKSLPTVAGINNMQVKEYLQNLQDEYLIRVEKIGSGNWYWSFKSDAKKSKENQINNLQFEETKLLTSIADAEVQIKQETARREDDDEMLQDGGLNRKIMMETQDRLLREMETLDMELTSYCDNDPEEVLRKVEETRKLRASALLITDNIESLESYIAPLVADRVRMAQMMHLACGDEYVIGEGLKDL